MLLGVKDCRGEFRFSLFGYETMGNGKLTMLLPIEATKLNANVDWWSTAIRLKS